MKITIALALSVLLTVSFASGCAHYSTNFKSLLGTNISDLEKMRSSGKTETVPLSYSDAFNKVTEILKNNELIIYQSNREKGYIVAMGFPKQTNTTRVGIFFESETDSSTKITLSSLSSTALVKAEGIIFGGFAKESVK